MMRTRPDPNKLSLDEIKHRLIRSMLIEIVLCLMLTGPAAAKSQTDWLKEVLPTLDDAVKNQDCATLERIDREGSEAGFAVAQVLLGSFYLDDSCKQDYAEAMKSFRRAADQGDALASPDAELHIGAMYVLGQGVTRSPVEVNKWILRSAEHGYPQAQYTMGLYYRYGDYGVPQDYVKAHMWLNLAASSDWEGNGRAGKVRDEVASEMSPAQIAEAQRLAREWKPKPFSSSW